ncbi:MAG: endo-beta-N-acetylglucosaminidase, partial [Prevotella sp.]|nr:endo-beta-N-acetylglucosaminidase [Prevotella sp.]
MKKRFLPLILGACLAGTVPVQAQGEMSPTSTSTIYDFAGYNESKILNLFYDVLKNKGRNYPTLDEFEAIGIHPSDIAFIRSHVAKRNIMDRSDRVNTNTYEKRNLFMNIPGGSGKGLGGYPSSNFANDVYSMWNYTNLFGSWNHGLFQAPGAWVDAAHKNGTTILSGIKFFDMTGNAVMASDKEYTRFITQKEGSTYKYVKPLINCLMYFGVDGINYNWEDASWKNADITAFHKALYKEAERIGFDSFHAVIYTSNSTLTDDNSNALFGNSSGRTFHLMLNYSGNDFAPTFASSVDAAERAMNTTEGLYGGVWMVTMNRSWGRLLGEPNWWGQITPNEKNKKMGVCLWGEHGESRFWSYNSGSDALNAQSNYQRLLERGFSGGNRNPVQRPPLVTRGIEW